MCHWRTYRLFDQLTGFHIVDLKHYGSKNELIRIDIFVKWHFDLCSTLSNDRIAGVETDWSGIRPSGGDCTNIDTNIIYIRHATDVDRTSQLNRRHKRQRDEQGTALYQANWMARGWLYHCIDLTDRLIHRISRRWSHCHQDCSSIARPHTGNRNLLTRPI